MPIAMTRTPLSLYASRLCEDGCRFRLHAIPRSSPYLYVREWEGGRRVRQFSLAPLRWEARDDVLAAYERCLEAHGQGRWPEGSVEPGPSPISWESLAEETIAWIAQRRPRSLPTYRPYLRQIAALGGHPHGRALCDWARQVDPATRGFTVRVDTLARIRDWGSLVVSDAMIAELRSLRPPGKQRRQVAREANRPRAIPDATLIQAWLDGIEDRPLQWAFALVATYGLRPHEVFHLESLPDADGWIQVGGSHLTKTGFRPVMPAPGEWVERYGLVEDLSAGLPWQPRYDPAGTCLNNQYLGGQLGKAMRLRLRPLEVIAEGGGSGRRRAAREIVRCVPYDLRHAWAIRLASDPAYAHIPTETAAELMGHGREVHKEIYLFWITKEEIQRGIKAKAGIAA